MPLDTATTSGSRRQHIKKFESRVLNRSCADFLFYDKVADFLLQCCSAEAKPNTLSLFSLVPLLICNCLIVPGEWWGYLAALITFLMHQVLDIANKKQAYRLSQFNLTTYYLDHLYDSISCILIVDITAKLFQLENETRIACIFFFAMLPFFTHHLAMYTTGYLTFYNFSPAVQGLLILEILFIFCAIFPDIPNYMVGSYKVSHFLIILCLVWLIIFLIDDIRIIARLKKGLQAENYGVDNLPLKNLFVIGIIGYIFMEMTMVQSNLLLDNVYCMLCICTFTLTYTFTISELILSYGYDQKHRQFTLNILITLLLIVIYYSFCGFVDIQYNIELLIGKILFGILFGGQFIYFFYYHYNNVRYLNHIIKEDQ